MAEIQPKCDQNMTQFGHSWVYVTNQGRAFQQGQMFLVSPFRYGIKLRWNTATKWGTAPSE